MSTAKIFDMVDEWNDAATTFTAIKMNVTATAFDTASSLIDLQVGGVSRFRVNRFGSIENVGAQGAFKIGGNQANFLPNFVFRDNLIFALHSLAQIVFTTGDADGAASLVILRDGANDILAQRRGANAQTSRIYGTFTDASNHRRLSLGMSTGGVAEIKPEGAGTGESGNVLHISGLPTSNPGPGILWNDGGDVKVGT